jgi:hypothetical protein
MRIIPCRYSTSHNVGTSALHQISKTNQLNLSVTADSLILTSFPIPRRLIPLPPPPAPLHGLFKPTNLQISLKIPSDQTPLTSVSQRLQLYLTSGTAKTAAIKLLSPGTPIKRCIAATTTSPLRIAAHNRANTATLVGGISSQTAAFSMSSPPLTPSRKIVLNVPSSRWAAQQLSLSGFAVAQW